MTAARPYPPLPDLSAYPMCGCAGTFVKHSAGMKGTLAFDIWHAVACKNCGATVGACDRRFRNKEDAADAWNRRAAREDAAAQPEAWRPQFDAMSPRQEELAVKFCAQIAGSKGQKGSPPCPVRLLEMAEALYLAERESAQAISQPPEAAPADGGTGNA